MKRPSMARRLTLTLGLIVSLVMLAMGWAFQHTLETTLQELDRVELVGRAELLRQKIEQARVRDPYLTALGGELDTLLLGHGRLRMWLLDAAGQPLHGGPGRPELVETGQADGPCKVRREDGTLMQALRLPLPMPMPHANGLDLGLNPRDGVGLGVGEIVVALDGRPREALLASHLRQLLGLGLAGLLATALLGGLACWQGLQPLRRLARASAALAPSAEGQRLPERHGDPGLDALAQAFNGVLARREAAYRQLETFNADVAHELRTPLATLINGGQVMLAGPRSTEELREALGAQLEVLEGLGGLVKDMLFLARADRGDRVQAAQSQPLSLARELSHCTDFVEALAEAARVKLRIEVDPALQGADAPPLHGHPALLRRALCNLLSNGIAHSAPGSEVLLRARWRAGPGPLGRLRLDVLNPGTPPPEALRARMFHRFVRGDAARSEREGYGLGLAIVQAVAHMHEGTVFAEPEGQALSVGLEWPLQAMHSHAYFSSRDG